ncbi:MAG: GNAT family N-acetyltransferase [Candidatus Delongbacteria bacterium]|nr:GNAT family N-acetyltransferase [Candidatus Delongbacteria bacterium]MCG2760660.1 GNAT family N-acetyltransferase [Candidatus Delongbacteria bacterium]
MKNFEELKWDSDFFDLKICKIEVTDYSRNEIQSAVDSALKNGFELIYLIIPDETDKNELFQSELIDNKVIFEKELRLIAENTDTSIAEYEGSGVSGKLYELALESGKYSRYKNDQKLPAGSYERLYRRWIENSVNKTIADNVFVYRFNNQTAGMVTLKIKSNHGEIGIFAVDGSIQGHGIGSRLIKHCENYLISKGINLIEVATQKRNAAACNFYEKNGYKIKKSLNYYHVWKKSEYTV